MPGYRDRGYPDRGYPDRGYPDRGYPDRGYPDRGYQDEDYRGGDYRDTGLPGSWAPGSGHRDHEQSGRGQWDRGHGDGYPAGAARSRSGVRYRDDPPAARPGRAPRRRDTTGGADGNERLTAATGAVLLVLFAAEGVTILAVRQLITLHFFVGMLLVGPVVLKAGATTYRFVRYYTGAPDYRRKGPPALLLRLLGPFVLATSVAVIGTGIMLGYAGSNPGLWLFAHKASFVLWFGVMTIHVLAYVWRLPRLISGDLAGRAGYRAREVLAGRPARWLLLTASVLAGLLLAVLTIHQAGAWLGQHTMIGGG